MSKTEKKKVISGVLEHIIFVLEEKNISYTLKTLGRENGFPPQIIVRFENVFIYIMKHQKRITYYIAEGNQKKRSISKNKLLKTIKEKY